MTAPPDRCQTTKADRHVAAAQLDANVQYKLSLMPVTAVFGQFVAEPWFWRSALAVP
jgi:hypothetical protein